MNLRPYQQSAIEAIETGWNSFSKQLAVLPTGAGKTICFSHLAKRRLESTGERTLILAHREELIEQAAAKLHAATGIVAEIEKAERWASFNSPVVVASVQTMRGSRLERWPVDHFGQIVCDEAHHAISDSWQKTLSRFDGHADVLGVTATPDRGDKRNLGVYFENVAAEVGLFDLIHDGYLSQITLKSIPLQIDLSKVSQNAGDYDVGELGDTLEPYLDRIAAAIKEHATYRKTLVFLPLIATSQKFMEACQKAGLTAGHVDGYCDNRAEILSDFATGKFQVLCNAMLLTEGYDDPSIDCVVILRPTRTRPLYCQMVGRGVRVSDFKENLLLLDFLWHHSRMNLIRPAHLVAKSEDEAEVITALAEEKSKGGKQEELELEGLATETAEKRHEALRKKLEENRKKKAKHIDALEWCLKMGQPDLMDYEPTMKWESQPVTEKQATALKRAGIDIETVKGKGHAMRLLDVHFRSQKLVLASEAQRNYLRSRGYANWKTATAHEAKQFFKMDRKAA